MSGTAAVTVKAVVNQRICNSGEFKVNSCYFFGHAFLIKRCDFSPPFCIVEEEGMTVLFWEQPMWPWVARVKILFWSRNPLTFFPLSLLRRRVGGPNLVVHFDPQSDNRKCVFAKRAKIGGAGDSCDSFFPNVVYFFHGQVVVVSPNHS